MTRVMDVPLSDSTIRRTLIEDDEVRVELVLFDGSEITVRFSDVWALERFGHGEVDELYVVAETPLLQRARHQTDEPGERAAMRAYCFATRGREQTLLQVVAESVDVSK